MRNIVLVLTLITASTAYAQDACSTSTSSSLPESAGCLPATFTPANGGPSRPVLLDVVFTNMQTGAVKVPPAAMKHREFELGAFGTYTQPDYGHSVNTDVGVYAVYTSKYFGIQADAVDTVINRGGIREASGVIGPRIQLRAKELTFYAKAQAGAGRFSGDPANRYSNKIVGAVEQYGGGMEVNVLKHAKLRVIDYSYQVWPEFSPRNLSPTIISSGLAVRF